MKQVIIGLVAVIFTVSAYAQPTTNQGTYFKIKLEEVVVKDSSGTIYPTELVKQLIATGKYSLRLSQDRTTGILTKLSEEEVNKRLSALPKPRESSFFKTGEKILSFNEKDMKGTRFNLKELKGKMVVLNFWFINCGPCRMEIPKLNELVEAYKNNPDVVFIAVALDDKYDIEEFLKTNPFTYHIIDGGRYLASRYGINTYPTNVVLDKEGKVIFHSSGYGMGTAPWIKKSIEAGLAGNVLQ